MVAISATATAPMPSLLLLWPLQLLLLILLLPLPLPLQPLLPTRSQHHYCRSPALRKKNITITSQDGSVLKKNGGWDQIQEQTWKCGTPKVVPSIFQDHWSLKADIDLAHLASSWKKYKIFNQVLSLCRDIWI